MGPAPATHLIFFLTSPQRQQTEIRISKKNLLERMPVADINTVTFDLWQTLLLDNREKGQARALVRLEGARDALAHFGEEYELDHIREAYRACYRHCRQVRDRLLDVSFREQVEIFINNISPGLVDRLGQATIYQILRVYADSFLMQPPTTHPDAQAVLSRLKGMDFRLGLISNTGMTPGATFRSYLKQEGLLEYFDTLTFSDEVKLAKPNNEIFRIALRGIGAEPSETVHVGDHVVNDVVGAKRSGMKTVWISGFYEREDPSDPETEADATVDNLGLVVEAVAQLAGRAISP